MADADFTVSVEGVKELQQKVDQLPNRIRNDVGRDALSKAGFMLEGYIKREKLSGQVLHVRSGRLRASVTAAPPVDEGADIVVRVGPHVIYARIHEFGGTIYPTRAQFLTIPMQAALTGAGVARFTARDLISSPQIGGFTRTFFRNHVLYGVSGTRGKPVPGFALKQSVTIPERPYLRPALAEKRGEIVQLLAASVERALKSL